MNFGMSRINQSILTLYQFKRLKESDQYVTVWKNGILLDARFDNHLRFLLYQIDSFYVEIKYNCETNELEGLKGFISIRRLIAYLNLN